MGLQAKSYLGNGWTSRLVLKFPDSLHPSGWLNPKNVEQHAIVLRCPASRERARTNSKCEAVILLDCPLEPISAMGNTTIIERVP